MSFGTPSAHTWRCGGHRHGPFRNWPGQQDLSTTQRYMHSVQRPRRALFGCWISRFLAKSVERIRRGAESGKLTC